MSDNKEQEQEQQQDLGLGEELDGAEGDGGVESTPSGDADGFELLSRLGGADGDEGAAEGAEGAEGAGDAEAAGEGAEAAGDDDSAIGKGTDPYGVDRENRDPDYLFGRIDNLIKRDQEMTGRYGETVKARRQAERRVAELQAQLTELQSARQAEASGGVFDSEAFKEFSEADPVQAKLLRDVYAQATANSQQQVPVQAQRDDAQKRQHDFMVKQNVIELDEDAWNWYESPEGRAREAYLHQRQAERAKLVGDPNYIDPLLALAQDAYERGDANDSLIFIQAMRSINVENGNGQAQAQVQTQDASRSRSRRSKRTWGTGVFGLRGARGGLPRLAVLARAMRRAVMLMWRICCASPAST